MRSEHADGPALNVDRVWWLSPGRLLVFFILPIYLFMALVVPEIWPHLLVVRAGNYMRGQFLMLGAACVAVLAFGCLVGSRLDLTSRPARLYEVNDRFMLGMGLFVVAAYLIWFWPIIRQGSLLMHRQELNHMPGVTSFTQLGVPFVVCYLYGALRAQQRFSRPVRALFYAILFLTVARVYIWSERLALIEVGVPAVTCVLAYYTPRRPFLTRSFQLIGAYGPFLGVPLLVAFFMGTEVVRSWSAETYQAQNPDFGEFMVSRLVTYYYTALNSGAGLLATSDWPDFSFSHTLSWFYRLPFGIGELFWSATGQGESPTQAFLTRFGDPEFSNMSGIFPVVYDLGFVGGLLYFLVLGLVTGMMYRGMRRERPLGILLFPPMFVACLEVLRIPYLTQPRCFLIFLGGLIAVTQFRPKRAATPVSSDPFTELGSSAVRS
jgi:oligosaccharide repeat unit polymerase